MTIQSQSALLFYTCISVREMYF